MALDKLVNSSQLDGALTSTANAIRAKTGETDSLTWDMDTGFSIPIGDIVTLDEGTADADATSADILAGKSAYVDGQKVEGSILAKASATYNTSSSDQEIASGQYLSGKQTIKAVTTANIDAANIKDGVNVKVGDVNNVNRIKNVTGTFTSASTVSSGQAAAVASDIKTGKSAWVDGAEVKGSLGNTSVSQGTSTKSGTTVTRGTASWGSGVISAGSIGAATFANEASSGQTYLDISDTEDSPVLVSGDNLYINKGYTDNLKISLAKLVPDGSDVKGHGEYILSGHSAYDDDGTLVAGTIQSQGAQTIYPKSSDQTIASGKYLSGTQTIKAVTTSGISAANIKHGTTVKVGDSADDDRITAVTGTFTKASTVSSGQTAATASKMLSGYSAWVDGAEVKGNIVTKTSSDMTVNGKTVTAPAGYYAESQSNDVAVGTVTSGTANITTLTKTYNSTNDNFDITGSANVSAPTVGTAGYVSSTEGTKNAKTGGATVTASISKIVASTAITGTTTKKPVISKQSTPSGVTNAASGNATTTAPSSGVYVAVKSAANTGTLTATPSVTTAGYGDATNNGITGNTATVGASASDTTYVPITTASPAFDGGTLSGGSTAEFTHLTTSSTNNGIKVQTKYTAASTAVLYNGAVNGWVNKADNTEALAAQSKSSTDGTAYYVTGVRVPDYASFAIEADSAASIDSSKAISVNLQQYRQLNVNSSPNTLVNVTNSGNTIATVSTRNGFPAGNVSVVARGNSYEFEEAQTVAADGYWVQPTVNAAGTYYGKVTVGSADPVFDGGDLSGNSTAVGTNVSINSTNDNGIEIQTKYTASSADVLYNGAVNGWVSKADNAQALAGKSLPSTNGTKYYISAITQPKDQVFRVTTEADTALDTSSDLTVINNAYRRVNVTNNANATTLVSSNKGEVNIFTPNNDAGKVIVDAYYDDNNKSGSTTIVTNGKWKQNNVTNSGTYYGRTTVGAGSTTMNTPTVNSSGLVTATSTVTAGYQGASTPSKTLQLSTQAGKTVTPTESEQTAVASGKYTTGAIKVAAISSNYVGSAIAQNDSDDLTADGATVTAPAGYYAEDATKTIASGSVTQNAPTINTSTGIVTATSTVTAGYVGADTKSNTLSLTTKAATTFNTSTSEQSIAAGTYLTGKQTIRPVTTSGIDAANIKDGAVIKVGDAGSATRIKNVTGTFTDASTVSSGQTAATAAQIRSGYSAWVDGAEVKGSLGNTSVSQGTTTVSGTTANRGTATWGTGVISSGSIGAATFANEGTSGTTYVDISSTTSAPVLVAGDYLYINKGYTDNLKISLARLVPDGSDVKGHGEYILSGHSAYDNDGTLVAGTIQTLAANKLTVSGKTVTVPVGYYTGASGATAVSTSVADGVYSASVSSHSISTVPVVTGALSGTVTDIGTTTKPSGTDGTDYWTITPSGSVTTTGVSTAKGKATIGTAGYIEAGNKETTASTKNITPTVNAGDARYLKKAVIAGSSTNATATTTVAPGTVSVAKQDVPSGVTNAASGDATTTAPSSGVYVAIKATAAANTTGTTSAISGSGSATVSTAGYAPTTLTGTVSVSGTATAKTSAKNSSVTYVPITTASPTFSSPTPSGGSTAVGTNATLGSTDNGIKVQTKYTVNQASVTYNAAVNGWVTKANGTEAVKTTARSATNGTAYYISGVTLVKPSSDTRTFSVVAPDKNGTNHTYLFTTDSAGNTTIKVDTTLTMQWNETDQSMDFIYT